mmetsp:Transcript_16773/g.27743  ORF Transcript_16773/g.27743 Transcript_16773/m.27743 type:complete len:681 (+) Transcript_16773:105-2147(+)|eukprot:CAMPEP_0184673950 /NCGR_PEP_ID=MMETSP0308-20130426/86970_1 /TAXON_ID=38269 /ORGANISM="Gloeochaete witrockiana, Strain SAG 46.84" /LENGTH=680 /DNA_ID=CAMNT_0027121503 /DNA_START=42 /DNA_END=2084 /DNA_ORIENTATION=+
MAEPGFCVTFSVLGGSSSPSLQSAIATPLVSPFFGTEEVPRKLQTQRKCSVRSIGSTRTFFSGSRSFSSRNRREWRFSSTGPPHAPSTAPCRCDSEQAPSVPASVQVFLPNDVKIHPMERVMGSGAFGSVIKGVIAQGPEAGTEVIVKWSKLDGRSMRNADIELYINSKVAQLDNDHIARFLGYHRGEGKYWLIWKREGMHTLEHFLDEPNWLGSLELRLFGQPCKHLHDTQRKFQVMREIVLQMLLGVDFIHKLDIVHRDIKPQNLILSDTGHIKIIDFGCSVDVGNDYGFVRNETPGTREFAPPELKIIREHPSAFDVFSVGMIMLIVAFPHLRKRGALEGFRTELKLAGGDLDKWLQSKMRSFAIDNNLREGLTLMNENNGAAWNLLRSLLHNDPARRPTAASLLEGHEFLKGPRTRRDQATPRPSLAPVLQDVLNASTEGWWRGATNLKQTGNRSPLSPVAADIPPTPVPAFRTSLQITTSIAPTEEPLVTRFSSANIPYSISSPVEEPIMPKSASISVGDVLQKALKSSLDNLAIAFDAPAFDAPINYPSYSSPSSSVSVTVVVEDRSPKPISAPAIFGDAMKTAVDNMAKINPDLVQPREKQEAREAAPEEGWWWHEIKVAKGKNPTNSGLNNNTDNNKELVPARKAPLRGNFGGMRRATPRQQDIIQRSIRRS